MRTWKNQHFPEETSKLIFCSKVENIANGEKSIALKLMKIRSAHTPSVVLKDKAGDVENQKEDVMKVITDYCEEFYSPKKSQRAQAEALLSGSRKAMYPTAQASLSTPVTLWELYLSAKDKTPGSDELPTELYVELRDLICLDFLELYEEMAEKGRISHSLRESRTTLLYKQQWERCDLKNKPPISPLNMDYNIIVKVMDKHLKGIIGQVTRPAGSLTADR